MVRLFQLSNELKLNVEELARLSEQLQEAKSRADEGDRIKSELEQLRKEDMELKEKFDSVVTEKENLLQVLNSNQDKDKEAVQLLQKELSAANNLVMEHAKEKEGLLAELESLKKTVAAEVESKNAVTEEISLAKQQIQQLSEDKKALEDQLQKSSRDEAEMKERVSNLERD
ncbi:unnamed protein product, partial [Haemonchus placei]|uniref:Myosin_tail_1 domain-containing protein n=1 Tax=Haemonchus placei TaxID=6290 RepID=A0A0N4VXI5_HAEPC